MECWQSGKLLFPNLINQIKLFKGENIILALQHIFSIIHVCIYLVFEDQLRSSLKLFSPGMWELLVTLMKVHMMHTQCLLYLSLMNGFFCSVESLSLFCTLEPKIGKRQHSHYLFQSTIKILFLHVRYTGNWSWRSRTTNWS